MRRLCRAKRLQFVLAIGIFLLISVSVYAHLGSKGNKHRLHPPNDTDPHEPSSVCHTPQCLASYESVNRQTKLIPSIRHILWKNDRVSRYFANQLKTWIEIHPHWKFVLWRDSDLDKFVAKHYPGVLTKYRSLPHFIMRIDMIRYMILHKFGGVYADLDYILVRPLDRFQRFPAVVTRETEVHSMFHFGMRDWPPPVLANPAFLMSEPKHPFFQFCISQLARRSTDHFMKFAGPLGLSDLLLKFSEVFPVASNPESAVYVPASRNFYPFKDNNLNTSSIKSMKPMSRALQNLCSDMWRASSNNLTAFCTNVLVLDPITDPHESVYAAHDHLKGHSSHDSGGSPIFFDNPVDIRSVLPTIVMADTFY